MIQMIKALGRFYKQKHKKRKNGKKEEKWAKLKKEKKVYSL